MFCLSTAVEFALQQRAVAAERVDCRGTLVKFLQHRFTEESSNLVRFLSLFPSLCAFCLIFPARSAKKPRFSQFLAVNRAKIAAHYLAAESALSQ